jgi:RNA polymerase sigma factor (sigma-70 family)
MQSKSDTELLRDYAASGSEAAFRELMRRYADFVYSAALRQVENPEAARDVTQIVFTNLARKAASLRADIILVGWLCRSARLAALDQLRRERRRQHWERQAMEERQGVSEDSNDWAVIRPVLDEALGSLSRKDRDALLLRFFRNESLLLVGETLGVTEDAAQKRVSRALGKLRDFLSGRGITTSTAALSAALAASAVQTAPGDLCGSLAATVLSEAGAGKTVAAFSKIFTLTKMKHAIITLGLTAVAVGLTYQLAATKHQIRALRATAEQQSEEMRALRAGNEQFAGQANELKRLRDEAKDVLRLRAEIARLRQEQAALKKPAGQAAQTETNSPAKERSVHIAARFISVPTKALGDVVWAKAPNGGSELMDDREVRSMVEALKNVSGTEFLSEPRIQTANGAPASLAATQQVPWNGTNVNVGETLHVEPHYSTNSDVITLDFAAGLTRFIDISIQQDESQRVLQTATITNSTSVVSGQSILLRQDLEDQGRVIGSTNTATGPKSLLLVITPTLVRDDGSVDRLVRVIKREEVAVPPGR